ncbi:MAG TPA: HAMP domain-containing sensor histidine kinase [Mycobacteriales bacterium]|nr:HAMP domain-containing sensor histidine kinase [Mycobacteriales bacterium]
MIQRSAAGSTLWRLRWLLAALFTAINAVGLVVFAWLAVRADDARGRQQLDGRLQQVTLAAIQRLSYSGDAVSFAGLAGSGLTRQCPGFVVLPGGAKPFLGLPGNQDCLSAPLIDLNRAATRAVHSNQIVVSNSSADGKPVRILADPFYRDNGAPAGGAVVATVDAGGQVSRHHRVVLLTVVGCGVVIVGLGVAGYLVAGRAMRPAANTLEQQERLLAESAHDLRTPVASLRALAETALHNPDQRPALLPRTVSLAGRMGDIIDDLLTRARLAAGVEQLNLQPVRLDQLVAGIVENTPAPDAEVTLELAESTVSADPMLVQRAVGNLLDNALRYGHEPGRPAQVLVAVEGGRVTVADRGPGLSGAAPAADRSGSNGLGLSIVRWVAEAHGGTLRVGSAAGGGAVFQLCLRAIPR